MATRLSPEQQEALLVDANRTVEEQADWAANVLCGGGELEGVFYPPNGGLTEAEKEDLRALRQHPEALHAVRKVVAHACRVAFQHLFCLIDADGEPHDYDGEWLPVTLQVPRDEEEEAALDPYEMAFLGAYWSWRAKRPDPGWTLDNWEGD